MSITLLRKSFTAENMLAYSGPGNLHSSDEAAHRAGLPRAIVQGGFLVACLSEIVLREFGDAYVRGGRIGVSLLKPVVAGTTVICFLERDEERAIPASDGRIHCRIRMETENGTLCAVGEASVPRVGSTAAGQPG